MFVESAHNKKSFLSTNNTRRKSNLIRIIDILNVASIFRTNTFEKQNRILNTQLETKQNKVITKRACFWVSCVYRLYLVKFGLNRSDCQRRTNDRDQMSSLLLLLFVIKLIRYCSLQIYPSGRVSCNWLSLRLVSLLFSLLIITPSYNCGHITYIDSTNLSLRH